MHELSIAHALVETALASLPRSGVRRVTAVHLRLGALSGVVRDALEFCYGIATEGTLLSNSVLRIQEVPAVVYCGRCQEEREAGPELILVCPVCGELCGGLRRGKELDLESVEIEVEDDDNPGPGNP
ncbi:MAG TPA: hydrogenase maturation nickel metallochaperone HypA [Solibacterales bacterium]|nr:hydrogenase maturation nickel metallochaperone HypA [Bryobacterales bacterium]